MGWAHHPLSLGGMVVGCGSRVLTPAPICGVGWGRASTSLIPSPLNKMTDTRETRQPPINITRKHQPQHPLRPYHVRPDLARGRGVEGLGEKEGVTSPCQGISSLPCSPPLPRPDLARGLVTAAVVFACLHSSLPTVCTHGNLLAPSMAAKPFQSKNKTLVKKLKINE